MDNIVQGVIGGSLYTLITKKRSNKQFRLGAVITNIPDLDIIVGALLPLTPMDQMFFHRGIMHSIIFNIGVAFVLGYMLYRSDRTVSYWRYVVAIFISILFGHLLIDGMTSYGMRYRLPFSGKTYSTDNIFVIDFGMWMITIGGLIWYMISQAKAKIARGILIAVGIYFSCTFVIQEYVDKIFVDHYPKRGIPITVINSHTLVEPLQPLLWRHLIKTPRGYYEGYYSLFDRDQKIDRKRSQIDKTGQHLVTTLIDGDDPLVAKDLTYVISFSRDNYRVVPDNQQGSYTLENMMFGTLNGRQQGAKRMFNFTIMPSGSGYAIVSKEDDRSGSLKIIWNDFWKRVRGLK